MQETQLQFLGWEDPLEMGWQPTLVSLPLRIPCASINPFDWSPVGYNPWGRRVRHSWATNTFTFSQSRHMSIPTKISYFTAASPPIPPLSGSHPCQALTCSPFLQFFHLKECYMNGIMPYVTFCDWLFSTQHNFLPIRVTERISCFPLLPSSISWGWLTSLFNHHPWKDSYAVFSVGLFWIKLPWTLYVWAFVWR